jgi:uncharacterized protein YcbX
MTGGAALAAIWRHPVKSLGRQALPEATLAPGAALPWDRTWALAHGASRFDDAAPAWTPCNDFARVTHSHPLGAVDAAWDEGARRLTLTRPGAEPLTADPDAPGGAAAVADWARAAAGEAQPGPFRLVRAPQAMTDSDWPSVSIASLASLRALGQRMGAALDPRRFRMNLWLDGLAPWEERGWVGREIAIGPVRLLVRETTGRCVATEVSPDTGRRDAAVMGGLRAATGATDFGVYAEVVAGGTLRVGDAAAPP